MKANQAPSDLRVLPIVIALFLSAFASVWAHAGAPPQMTAGGGLPNLDVRVDPGGGAVLNALTVPFVSPAEKAALAGTIEAARQALNAQVRGLVVESHPALEAPEVVTARGGFLTGPTSAGPEAAVRGFLTANAGLFGLTSAEVTGLITRAAYANPAGNLQWVTLEQRINGMRVFRAELRAAVTKAGEVASITSELAAGVDASRLGKPAMTPGQAVLAAASNIGAPLAAAPALLESSRDGLRYTFQRGPFTHDITVELMVFPLGPAQAVLAWRAVLWPGALAYSVVVDDATGHILFRKNLANEQSQSATFEVYGSDSPGPLSPSPVTPGSGIQGPAAARSTFTLVSEVPAFDLLGWITDGGNVTSGNNVDARLSVTGSSGTDASGHAIGLCPTPACRHFVFSYNPPPGGTDAPTLASSRLGALTNVFFWANHYHDQLYTFGFTEAARNFQSVNFGPDGLGNDPVVVLVQEPAAGNNAFFVTQEDGATSGAALGIFTGPDPDRDVALDQHVVLHELTHGLSNRLIGNSHGLGNAQGLAMGEGWSDFYALSLLSDPSDNPALVYPVGAWAFLNFLGSGFTDNYFHGARRFPYTTNMSLNPITFADIDPGQINVNNGTYPPHVNGQPANEPHNAGEVWTAMLWEARANIVAALGGTAGNARMLQITTDGMKLTPTTPRFTQARDAIIQADCAGYSGSDEISLWKGFAKRGLGFSAVAPSASSGTLSGVVEKFDLPLTVGALVINDTAGGNGNGVIEPGETVALTIPAASFFQCKGLTGVTATLSTATPGVTVTQASGSYGSVSAGATVAGTAYQIFASAHTCGTVINLTLAMTSAEGVTATRPVTLHVSTACAGILRDFNGDGKADILWRNTTGDVALWLMNGATIIGSSVVASVTTDWSIAGAGDFNGDGKADILWRRTSGELALWHMNGPNILSASVISTVTPDWTVAGVADFNGDGKADILWRRASGEVAIWLMNGFSIIGSGVLASVTADWTIAGVGDFNADGKADILWRNTNSGEVGIWLINGTSIAGSSSLGIVSLDWTMAGVADFNGDGQADLLWRNTTSGLLAMWTSLTNTGAFTTVATNWTPVKVGDFSGDGKADILWRNTAGDLALWTMNGPVILSSPNITNVPLSWITQ